MHPDEFHERVDQSKLIAAIADAERQTLGKIYVYVSHRHIDDAMAAARKRFARLGLNKLHEHGASVLIYVAPRTHKFAIVGDHAIHEQCGEVFWSGLAERLSADLKAGDLTAALLNAVAELKANLAEYFPR